jgi:hypothetical protein
MAPTPTTTSLKRSRSSTPSLGTRPSTPNAAPGKVSSAQPDLSTGEPRIKQELDHWEKIVFSFDMDDNRGREGDPNFPDDGSAHPHQYMHQSPRGRGLVAAQHDAPLLPPASAWDIPPFFPASAYDQQPYDVLALGAIGPMPGLSPPHSHPSPNPHALLDFGHSSWDMNFYPELQAPQPQLQPLSPAEIAQYHALMARGAGEFPPPLAPNSGSSSTAASSSAAQADSSMRDRSGSSAGRSSSQSQPPSAPTSPIDDEGNINIAEDKRRRNTAASGKLKDITACPTEVLMVFAQHDSA